MIKEFVIAFYRWRGDKEIINIDKKYGVGIAYDDEIHREKNWKFMDYYKDAKKGLEE